jgi:hypothetical protein
MGLSWKPALEGSFGPPNRSALPRMAGISGAVVYHYIIIFNIIICMLA